MTETQLTIDRSIAIDAPPDRVWRIVSVPGWWVNKGSLVEHELTDLGDGVTLVKDPELGEFRVSTVELRENQYAAFRWHPTDPDDPSTLTEFWITEQAEGGVVLRVVESDFGDLPDARLHAFLADNTAGWESELALARGAAEQSA